jgi:hypothetical protein
LLEDWGSTRALTFERIEPEIDEELEAAKRKFPVGSTFKSSSFKSGKGSTIYTVKEVREENLADCVHELCIISDDDRGFLVSECTPFPLPVWRCCYADKPKTEGRRPVRLKNDIYGCRVDSFQNGEWGFSNARYEWLDEGER